MTVSLRTLLDASPRDLVRGPLREVEVAILDSGIDATHPDLEGRVVAAIEIVVDGDRIEVRERAERANADLFGHGTAVAGIVARNAPNARIVDVRVLGSTNAGTGAALLRGLEVVLERRSPIVNMSLAARRDYASRLVDACERAHRQGQIVVAAKRNVPLGDLGYPAELCGAIAVDAATIEGDGYALRVGDVPIELAAPGDRIVVPAAGGGHTVKSGASFAAPHVSALCALALGAAPSLRPYEVKSLLRAWASKNGPSAVTSP